MAIVFVPSPLRRHTGGQSRVEVPGATVGEVLGNLTTAFPGLSGQILDEAGQVRAYINVFVNGNEIRTLRGQATPVGAGDEVSVIPAMAGGRGRVPGEGLRP
ncbi:MAG: MoaD/ThiS family protein [Armatimonadetes bacterium]|nr:MoaD/ThiS family protein [Armatimonadota bacterium]